MKNWNLFWFYPILGFVSSSIFGLLMDDFFESTVIFLCIPGTMMGLLVGLLFAGTGTAIGRKVNTISETAGSFIGGVFGSVVGGIVGYYAMPLFVFLLIFIMS